MKDLSKNTNISVKGGLLPPRNTRVREIINHFAGKNVSKFCEMLNDGLPEDSPERVSQQRLNRLFNIDTRTKKYPSVPTEILARIIEVFTTIDEAWLLTGKGKMLLSEDADNKPNDLEGTSYALPKITEHHIRLLQQRAEEWKENAEDARRQRDQYWEAFKKNLDVLTENSTVLTDMMKRMFIREGFSSDADVRKTAQIEANADEILSAADIVQDDVLSDDDRKVLGGLAKKVTKESKKGKGAKGR